MFGLPELDRDKVGDFFKSEKKRIAFDEKKNQWKPRHLIRMQDRSRLDLVDEMIGYLVSGKWDGEKR